MIHAGTLEKMKKELETMELLSDLERDLMHLRAQMDKTGKTYTPQQRQNIEDIFTLGYGACAMAVFGRLGGE